METWRVPLLPFLLRWLLALLATFGMTMLALDGTSALATQTGSPNSPNEPRRITFQERLDAQRAIEEVLWKHRIWPKENPGPKPPLSAVLSEAALREKVTDSLKKSNALEKFWNRSITGVQLQAEMNRMAKHTRQPEILREMFAALHDDAFLIAECLARPAAADRLLRSAFAGDERFQGDLRESIQRDLARFRSPDLWKEAGGRYREETWRRAPERMASSPGTHELSPGDYGSLLTEIAHRVDPEARSGPRAGDSLAGSVGPLREDDRSFSITTVLEQDQDSIRIASLVWEKTPFDRWWKEARSSVSVQVALTDSTFVPLTVDSGSCSDDSWRSVGASRPDPRYYHSAVWTGTEMVVWGGRVVGNGQTSSGGRYDPVLDLWTPTFDDRNPAHVPSAREQHSAVWTGTRMIIWGGRANVGPSPTGGGIYDPATDSWDLDLGVTPSVPSSLFSAATVWTGTEMIAWGGIGPAGNVVSSGWRFNPSSRTWAATSVTSGVPAARGGHSGVWTGSEMIVWGGTNTMGAALNTGGRYNPASDSWTPTSLGAGVPAGRSFHRAVWSGSEMIVWGGIQNSTVLNSGARYDPLSNSWIPMTPGPNTPAARQGHSALWTGSEMIVWGGATASGGLFASGGRYNPASDSWTAVGSGGLVPRSLHTAVWTGTEMIVWGGGAAMFPFLFTGSRYNPSTDTWIATSSQLTPGPRLAHTTVWTGTELIVWGGTDNLNGSLDTGARLEPATMSWTPLQDEGAPTPRVHHSAVWSGTEMIVWGGNTFPSQSGGRYNPASDSWTPTSAGENVPAGRSEHSAIWSGTEMIVWGGVSYATGTPIASGARYDPVADAWAPVSEVNAPSARTKHAAVWTGSEMIVWGGENYPSYFDSGGKYDPSSDTWQSISPSGAPSPRSVATAVWTGDRMIVWGGYGGTANLGSGGRYDPAADSWSPTASASIAPRSGHSAVWTDHEMIVIGGRDDSGHDALDFGRYNPSTDSWSTISNVSPVHLPRAGSKAVWTGEEMVIFGGVPFGGAVIDGGARYCHTCNLLQLYYRDTDGDHFGDVANSGSSCDASPPSGFVVNAADCSDLDASAWSVPAEVQGVTAEPGVPTQITWSEQGADAGPGTSYEVVSGSLTPGMSFPSCSCVQSSSSAVYAENRPTPLPGAGFWYLVRASNTCGVGTFGTGSLGFHRDNAIPASP
ncbi:MAG TPA: kelch repeat-containing protein [Candidatus Polarisedimenticolia bacterium]|nr:kelch repeat-containing protein [Candidatus Polarisedimenticolia bacterium]